MRRILTACSEDGRTIILSADLKREELRKWRETRSFFCPQCRGPVQLKVGNIVVPHFAHLKDTTCRTSFSEGESPQHLTGKLLLHQLLTANSQNTVLEPLLAEISQRPDLLILNEQEKIPIEFQCSTIPISLLEERTDGFRKIGMPPIWILHTPTKFANFPEGIGTFQFSKFEEWFIVSTPPEGDVLLTFNPQMKTFHYFTSLLHVAGQRYIGMHHILPVNYQSFPFLRPKIPLEKDLARYVNLYNSKRHEDLERSVLLNRKGITNPFLRCCYEMRILPTKLPAWVGVPVSKNQAFREADFEWQLRLLHFLKRKGLGLMKVNAYHLRQFVRSFENPSTEKISACQNYLSFLVKYGVDNPLNNTDFSEKVILYIISERFLANDRQN
ncbi:competence protein CoiA [Sporosarcina highlanderae]|uniref:Competence protein CoiA family protein n=1 Tax=Sporosarcina highlanderae TaxID=3035916 RepID=A0ABT8JNY1_9BACL|nr:competence protein CoiA family protein [Sporosarcina highlanderae]MDN4606863.1 competence protein CoiA family protein [Sporosarcina highlanderae]